MIYRWSAPPCPWTSFSSGIVRRLTEAYGEGVPAMGDAPWRLLGWSRCPRRLADPRYGALRSGATRPIPNAELTRTITSASGSCPSGPIYPPSGTSGEVVGHTVRCAACRPRSSCVRPRIPSGRSGRLACAPRTPSPSTTVRSCLPAPSATGSSSLSSRRALSRATAPSSWPSSPIVACQVDRRPRPYHRPVRRGPSPDEARRRANSDPSADACGGRSLTLARRPHQRSLPRGGEAATRQRISRVGRTRRPLRAGRTGSGGRHTEPQGNTLRLILARVC